MDHIANPKYTLHSPNPHPNEHISLPKGSGDELPDVVMCVNVRNLQPTAQCALKPVCAHVLDLSLRINGCLAMQ